MGLVKGFTDIIAPQNLATNGSFRINQRGLFTSTYENVKVGDFVCDAWKCSINTIDFLQVNNTLAYGILNFTGYGKKGQVFTLENVDKGSLAAYDSYQGAQHFTASITARQTEGQSTIPVHVGVAPRHHTTGMINTYEGGKVLSSTNFVIQPTKVIWTTAHAYNTGAKITATLMADGNFDFILSGFQEFIGAFVNPPAFSGIPLADDLLRCKRYYQSKIYECYGKPIVDRAGTPSVHFAIPLEVTMAATPSASVFTDYSLSTSYVNLYDTESSGITGSDAPNWSVSSIVCNSTSIWGLLTRNAPITNRNVANISIGITTQV